MTFWFAALGIPTWLRLYEHNHARIEQQALLALFAHIVLPPPPPHYLHFHLHDLDEHPNLDPILPYTVKGSADPPPPRCVPTPLPEDVIAMNEALAEANNLIAENLDLMVDPDLTEFELL
ncbi:hypothetical protein BKA82DRAFT_31270 [Pisolithus tinctorius]|uniref:Uncharacterized protein n=1 Tax=Pisolithus tinctorius Marx 270 TaxID=870435 RepID=A0A0C3INS5_PISTI|nr:hypothetical protein BKA82DRAFT_31270 [Pisolithus tinctorius]KIN98627.1 hypothetical protein M404DRAFT_31270 [Pisolithus tinctorius Marx 270]